MGQISLVGQAAALHNLASNGLITRTAASTVAARSLSAGGGINVQNSDGVSGNPGVQLADQAKALNELASSGLIARTAASTVAARSLSAGDGIDIQNGNGVSANPGIQLGNQAKALNSFSNHGVLYRKAANTFTSMLTGGIGLGFFPNYDAVPATNISPGAPGEMAIGNTAGVTYFYVCTATDRWGRVQISSW